MYKRSVRAHTKKTVAASQQWRCAHCQDMLDALYEVDHCIPLFQGGTNAVSNLQALCPDCHSIKTREECSPLSRTIKSETQCLYCNQIISGHFKHKH